MILTSVSRTTIILSVPGIKRERTVIVCQNRKDVARVSVGNRGENFVKIGDSYRETLSAGGMKRKMMILRLALCSVLILHGTTSMGKPLTPEDVEGLLPPTPKDKNETIAAVVQDPVVQDAVHQAASNGSLNGLVVKKDVFIMPATNPKMVLSKREHLLVVPTENLEDVRKNITQAKLAEAQETSTLENQEFFEEDASEYSSEKNENEPTNGDEQLQERNSERPIPLNEKLKSETEFLKDTVSNGAAMPEDASSKKVAVPIVAVIDPSKAENGKVKSPIVAILPNQVKDGALNTQVQFLKDNSDKIQKKAQNFVDQSSMTVIPDYSTPSEIAIISSPTQGTESLTLGDQEAPRMAAEEMYLTPVMGPQWAVFAPSLQDDRQDYSRETGDMDVAEDIIFRPLFRYRQESQQRSKYYDDSNRRYGYGYSGNYPRRAYFYRPRYDDY